MSDDIEDVSLVWKQALRDAHTILTECKEPEWVEGTAETRKHLVRLFAENQMVAQGYVPSSWRHSGNCEKCGVVPLDTPADGVLVGCPWCASKSKPKVFTFL